MSTNIPRSLFDHFVVIEDIRDEKKRRHLLIDMLVIAITAVICGADGWTQVAAFGKAKEAWFRQFLQLPNGIPSHDTFGRVFSVLSPEVFEARFREWVASVREVCGEDIVAIDGKSLRRSHCRKKGLGPLHMVSAWSVANGLVLAQQATEAKSNEIAAIPEVLALLERKGCIVTIDARQVARRRSRRTSSRKVGTMYWRSKAIRARWRRRSKSCSSMPMPSTTPVGRWTATRRSIGAMGGSRRAATSP